MGLQAYVVWINEGLDVRCFLNKDEALAYEKFCQEACLESKGRVYFRNLLCAILRFHDYPARARDRLLLELENICAF